MNRLFKIIAAAILGAGCYASFLGWRAHSGLVTLHVRNAPLESVVSKLRWQTWEKFVVKTNVTGAITLDVHKMPLEQVLGVIGEQLNGRWTAVYPIYREKTSLVSLKRALRGEADFANTGFTNYAGPRIGFRNQGPDGLSREARPVTLHLANTDLAISALALERFGGGQVLVEKNASAKINLELSSVPFQKAVAKVAQAAHRSSTRVYALEPIGNPEMMALNGGERRPRRNTSADADAARAEQMQAVLQTLPEEERKKSEERQLERAAMESLTQEQRQQVMAERMNSGEMQARAEQRSISNIKNTTPEQRRDRYERMFEMRKARAAGVARNG